MTDFTTSLHLKLPDFDISPWHDDVNDNFTILDAAFRALTGLITQGAWTNNTPYTVGQQVVDTVDGIIWVVATAHTSAAAPTTFAQDRVANPSYWTQFTAAVTNRGVWTTATAYNTNDFVTDANRFGIVVTPYTSGASYNADVAGGKIATLIDMTGYVTNGIGQSIAAASTKATLINNDLLGIADSADSNNLKKLTYSQFLTNLQSVFFTESEITTNYYTKTEIDANTYDTTESDARFVRYNGVQTLTDANQKQARDNVGIPDRGYIFGYDTANNATDIVNDINIHPGRCMSVDPASPTMMENLLDPMVKRLDALWSVGTGNGMLDVGTISDNTYHIHAIKRMDTGVCDILASKSHDERGICTMTIASPCVVTWPNHGFTINSTVKFTTTGALPTGLVAGTLYYVITAGLGQDTFQVSLTLGGAAVNTSGTQSGVHTAHSTPVLPAGYTHFRRIWSIMRRAGSLIVYRQFGNVCKLVPPIVDRTSTAAVASSILTVTCPYGINSWPMFVSRMTPNLTTHITNSIGDFDTGAVWGTFQICNSQAPGGGSDNYAFIPAYSVQARYSQIYWATTITAGSIISNTLTCLGWVDERGQNDVGGNRQ